MRTRRMRTSALRALVLTLSLGMGLAGLATSASAAKVDLKGVETTTTGSQKLKIKGLGTCSDFLSLSVQFKGKKFSATDNLGQTYKGTYKQSGKDGRKLVGKYDKKSRKKQTRALKTFVQNCSGERNVDVDIDDLKLTGKINKALDTLRITVKIKADGQAGGEKGEATYTGKTSGPLNLGGEF